MSDTMIVGNDEQTTERSADLQPVGATSRLPTAPRRPTPVLKRLFDVAVALPAALATAPAVIALGAVSAFRFRSTPLFTQPRLGHGGKVFKFWKIRSLPSVAPETADKYQLKALDLSRYSRTIRHRHIDELPQLWQVVFGQMSLIGPRPEMLTLSQSFDHEFVAERLTVKPGLTGLWQVSRDSRGLIGESPEWDLHYVRNRTFRLDLWICYRSVLMMTRFREVESLDDIPRWTGAAPR